MPKTIDMTLMGTGTSTGVPMVGCTCRVCTSSDPRDTRLRCSALLQWDGMTVVIDTTPEFRLQMLRHQVMRLDAVLLTHNHADHIHGLDDVRPYCFLQDQTIPVYGDTHTLHWVRKHFAYIWDATQKGGGLPRIDLHEVATPFDLGGVTVTPLEVMHGAYPIHGYRIGDLAYITDVSHIPDATMALLEGVRTLILDSVRYEPHATHFHVDKAIEVAREIGAKETWFTHINHDILHEELVAHCPDGMGPAHDGLRLTIHL